MPQHPIWLPNAGESTKADMNGYAQNDQVRTIGAGGRQDWASPEISFGLAEKWVIEIKRFWAQRRFDMIELAKVVYAAKRELLYGQWTHLLKSRRIPFAKRTAEMLVVIAKGLGRLDAQSCAHLPSALNSLYHLAQLEQAVLVSLIAEGTIHPALTISEAKGLLAEYKPQRNGSQRQLHVKRRLSTFREFVFTTLSDWTPEERALAKAELLELAEQVGAPMKWCLPNQNRRHFLQETVL